MDRAWLFSIGTIGKMFHLSVSSLRHYEAIGLLTPEYIDPESGYRYYSTRQFEVLNTIRYLRALDMPLQEISDYGKSGCGTNGGKIAAAKASSHRKTETIEMY